MEYVPPLNGNLADPDRSYINANPGTGTEGSIPVAEAIEHPIREIVHVIEEAGLTPDGGDLTQLYQAIAALIAAAAGSYASDSEAFAGTISNKGVVPSNFVKSFGTSGYARFPGGLIIQWGSATVAVPGNGTGGEATVSFPLAFPNSFMKAMVSREQTTWESSFGGPYCDKVASSNSQIVIGIDEAATMANGNVTATYLAVGY